MSTLGTGTRATPHKIRWTMILTVLAAFIAGCLLGGVAMVAFTGLALRALGWS